MIGAVVGNYRIVAELGRGGMGIVYEAEHTQLGRAAALKMLLPQMSSDPTIVQRFFNEARAASSIDHPGIVEIYDFGTHVDGRAYLVMALLRGQSLDHRLVTGALPPIEGATIVAQVASALAAAHARGIVHRDLKPDNIFLIPNELLPHGTQVKLLDFGIAKLADERASGFRTQTGALIGTPAYMSPEQCMGRPDLDHRTDLYSLGCILFHVLVGRPPFISDQGTGVMLAAHMRDPAPHPRSLDPRVPEPLASITMRLLEKDPAARFQTATELRTALVAAGAVSTTRPGIDQYAATMVPPAPQLTTRSGSAAQLVTAPAPPRRTGLIVAAVTLSVVAAAAIAAVALRTDEPSPSPAKTVPASTITKAPAAPAPAAPAPRTAPPAPPPAAPPPAAPPPAAPRPPPSARPTAPTAPTQTHPPAPNPAAPSAMLATSAPTFTLAATRLAPSASIEVRFAAPVPSPANRRSWITVVEKGRPPSSYGTWAYVADGATSATLAGPAKPGSYEVRLHTDYPARTYNVRHTVALTIADPDAPNTDPSPASAQRFTVARARLRGGDPAVLRFPAPLHAAPGERFWVTVVASGTLDTAWGTYEYVPDGARTVDLVVPTAPGAYELRLHANYPRRTTNVVHRVPIRVD